MTRVPFPLLSLIFTALFAAAGLAPAAESRRDRAGAELDRLGVFLEMLQADPSRQIPPEILREARAVVVVRETRAGFILGGRDGTGAASLRTGQGWGAPAFVRTREGGIGLQAGWQNATFVHLLMTDAAVAALRTNRFRFGVGLRITSGPRTVGDEAKTKSTGSDVLLYADTGGLYGGLAFEGGSLSPLDRLNRDYYGMTFDEILFERPPSPADAARRFVDLLERFSRPPPKPGG